MEENDITLADMILASLMSESEHIMLYVIHEKATDEAQAQRVILSLCSYGAAHETDIHLEKTDKTANLIALGGARYIYEQERLKEKDLSVIVLDGDRWDQLRKGDCHHYIQRIFRRVFPYHENGKSYNEPFRLERNREIIPATSYRNTAHPIFVPTYCFSRIGSYPAMTSPLHRPLV